MNKFNPMGPPGPLESTEAPAENRRPCLLVAKCVAAAELRNGGPWYGSLPTRAPWRVPRKTTTQGTLLPSQPVRCSVEEVYGGLAQSCKVYSYTLAYPLSPALLPLSSSLGRPVRIPFQK